MLRRTFVTYGAGALVAGAMLAVPVAAQQVATIGTSQLGSASNLAGSALASVLEKASGTAIEVRAFTSSETMAELASRGDLTFAMLTSVNAYMAYQGIEPFTQHFKDLRVVMYGADWIVGAVVLDDSDIRSAADMRGKRASGGYNAHPICADLTRAIFANAGISTDDVRSVPVGHAVDGVQALVAGRVDVASCAAAQMGALREADARRGVRYLPVNTDNEAMKRARDIIPVLRIRNVAPGEVVGVKEPRPLLAYQSSVVTSADADGNIVKAMLEMAWTRQEELSKLHPLFRDWGHDAIVGEAHTVPFHDAAVEFFKEKGVWNDELQAIHERLLAS